MVNDFFNRNTLTLAVAAFFTTGLAHAQTTLHGTISSGSYAGASISINVPSPLNLNGINNTGNISTSTLSTTSNANVGGNLSVTGNTTMSGTLDVSKDATLSNTTVNGTLDVNGDTTMTGDLDVTGTTSLTSVDGNTNLTINDEGISGSRNGAVFKLSEAESTLTNSAGNGLNANATGTTIQGNGASMTLADTDATLVNSVGNSVALTTTTAQMTTVTSGGLIITDNTSALMVGGSATGGTNMTLNNSGVSFAQNDSGKPVTVTGVADGVKTFDAVNYRQLKALEKLVSAGIASTSAAANIPAPEWGKTSSFGVGLGHFNGRTALAVGGTYRFSENGVIKASLGSAIDDGNKKPVIGVGASWSW